MAVSTQSINNQKKLSVPLYRLPGQTEAIYWIIILSISATAFASMIGDSPTRMGPIILTLFLLPIYTILSWPDKEIKREDKEMRASLQEQGILAFLQTHLTELASECGYRRPIHLIISSKPNEARAFGSWRRHYVLLGGNIAEKLYHDALLPNQQDKAKAVLMHEIGHLLHKDVQRISFTRELLRSCFVVLMWWALVLVGWLTLSFRLLPAFLALDLAKVPNIDPLLLQSGQVVLDWFTPELRAEMVQKAQEISLLLVVDFIVQSFLPIIAVSFVLWLFYWRQMVRMQEYYADSLARYHLSNEKILLNAYGRYPAWFKPASKTSTPESHFSRWKNTIANANSQLFSFVARQSYRPNFRWLALHPSYKERYETLNNPLILNQNWCSQAIVAGVLLVAMGNFLISPMISYYLMDFPAHALTIIIFVLLSTWVLPLLVSHQPIKKILIKTVGTTLAIYFGWLLLNILLLIVLVVSAPQLLIQMLNFLVFAMARVSSSGITAPITSLAELSGQIPKFIATQLLLPLGIVLSLVFYRFIHGPALYSSHIETLDWRKRHWWSIIAISIVIIVFGLNPLTLLIYGSLTELLSLGRIVSYIVGCVMMFILWQIYRVK